MFLEIIHFGHNSEAFIDYCELYHKKRTILLRPVGPALVLLFCLFRLVLPQDLLGLSIQARIKPKINFLIFQVVKGLVFNEGVRRVKKTDKKTSPLWPVGTRPLH